MKVSILCLGNIAAKMAQTLNALPEAEPYAVASRTANKAGVFAAEYGFQRPMVPMRNSPPTLMPA